VTGVQTCALPILEVQAWCTTCKQTLTEFNHNFVAKGFDAGSIITIGCQLLANPAWNLGTGTVRKADQVAGIGDWHNARRHRNINSGFLDALYKVEISIWIEKELG